MEEQNKSCQGYGQGQSCPSTQQPPQGGQQAPGFGDSPALRQAMSRIKHKIAVLSGKGGVGKSTVSANLALALAEAGKQVGLLDVDIHGPSIPKLLNIEDHALKAENKQIIPVQIGNLKAISIGLLLAEQDQALIWRGPMKMGVIKQFLEEVKWGDLDYLVVDCPPGTGDEPLSIVQLIGKLSGAVMVTTPQDLAILDVRKCITFCNKVGLPVLGVVENMSGFVCPECGHEVAIFKSGGGEKLASELKIPFLGKIPIDPTVAEAGDSGTPYLQKYKETPTGKAFEKIIEPVLRLDGSQDKNTADTAPPAPADTTGDQQQVQRKENCMRIAIPAANGKLALHFGHCQEFIIIDIDREKKTILSQENMEPPGHEPGVLPRWLHSQGVDTIIAGGMGQRAQQLFNEQNISVVVGAPAETPEVLVNQYLDQTLQTGENFCDH